jgi:hypothetical protein
VCSTILTMFTIVVDNFLTFLRMFTHFLTSFTIVMTMFYLLFDFFSLFDDVWQCFSYVLTMFLVLFDDMFHIFEHHCISFKPQNLQYPFTTHPFIDVQMDLVVGSTGYAAPKWYDLYPM